MNNSLDVSKRPILVFVGTLKHHVDCIAPCVGKLLEKEDLGYEIIYCDQTQIKEVADKLEIYDKEKYQVLVFDVAFLDSSTKFRTSTEGIYPATFINKEQNIKIGDFSVLINIKDIYSGSLSNQKKKLLRNDNNKKIQKRVDKRILDTYLALKKILSMYNSK